MEQNPENYDFGLKDANVKIMNRNTDNAIKSHKCNQCSYSSSRTGHLETNSTMEKSQINATNVTMHPLLQAL